MSEQFEDAQDSISPPTSTLSQLNLTAPRQPGHYLDDDIQLPPIPAAANGVQEELEEEDEQEEDWDASDQEWEQSLMGGLNEVMDQDWGDVGGDFTKRYNRMRQHVVATHAAVPRSSLAQPSSDPAIRPGNLLPAVNRPSRPTPTDATPGVHLNKVTDQLASYSRYASQIDLAPLYPTSNTATRKGGSEKVLIKDKSDRATNEQVLDPRTRLIIFKMIGRGLIERIDGCVSTGKEANVYHAVTPSVVIEGEEGGGEQKHLALKIYKTSILVFKDRDRYVSGEFRFKSGYARSNPRKMVRLWAEKEMRNLRRMKTAGLRVPEAIEVRENVLVMQFMGAHEWQASPRLKDAQLPTERLRDLYIEMLVILRVIFVRCKLVHADFSEYNVLYHEDHLWVIDVSQSVEQDHPAAFDFLRSDLHNCEDFFARRGVDTLGLTRTFNYVTRKLSGTEMETDEEMRVEAERLLDEDEAVEGVEGEGREKRTESDEAVFAQSYIPRALDQVYDIERDVAKVLRGEGKDLIYADITGVVERKESVRFEETKEEGEESSESESEEESDEEEGEEGERRPRGKKHEDKDEKKKRRQETKEKAREKRSNKMKKGDKARRVKKTSGKK